MGEPSASPEHVLLMISSRARPGESKDLLREEVPGCPLLGR